VVSARATPATGTWLVVALLATFACTRPDGDAVVLWHSYSGAERAVLEDAARAYNETAAPGARVALVAMPHEGFADQITNAIPNGNGPDLFIFPGHDRIGDWLAAGIIEPIEYFVDEALADDYADDAIAAMAFRGSLYGLPLSVKSLALFYRTDMVPEPPRTTDELWTVGRRLTDRAAGRYALVYENGNLYPHAAWLHGFGGRVFDDDGALTIATPEAEAAMRFAQRLGGPHGIVPPEVTVNIVATLFNQGDAAMALSGPWFIADIRPDVTWKIASLPVVSETGLPAAPFLGAEGVLMSSRARDKVAAFAVMAHLAGDTVALDRARRARQVVPNVAVYDDPEIAADPVLAAFRAQLEHTVPMPATPEMRMVWTPYEMGLKRAIAQGVDPGPILRAMQAEIAGYIAGAAGAP
jgi:maltose-binding protein MalE